MNYVVEVTDDDRHWEEIFLTKPEAADYALGMLEDGYSVKVKSNSKIRVTYLYGVTAAEGLVDYADFG